MSRQFTSLHLVGDAASPRANAARLAADTVQPGALMRHSASLSAATAAPVHGCEVLVLLDPTAGDFKIASAALNQRGLPRWAVVPGREEPPGADLAAEDWEVPVLARSMAFALSLLALRRDNARLAG